MTDRHSRQIIAALQTAGETMAQSKKRPPIRLAGIKGGAISPDGDRIAFTLEAHDKRTFTFSVPHEAIGEIVSGIWALSDQAAARRPAVVLPASGTPIREERTFPLEQFLVSGLPGGGLVLTLYVRGTQNSVILEREHARKVSEALLGALKRTAN